MNLYIYLYPQFCEMEVNKIVWPREKNHRDGFSCLHYAAKKGRYHILEEIFHHQGADKYALDINLPSTVLGWAPLHYTAYSGNIQAMKVLLKQGANVNYQGKDGKSPLHVAIDKGMKKAVVALVNSGADVNLEDSRGYTPLHYCALVSVDNDTDCTQKNDTLQDKLDVTEFLLTRSSKAGIRDMTGNLPLHLALQSNTSLGIVKILCSALPKPIKDSINQKNHNGYAPVHLCTSAQQLQVLLSFGADVNMPTHDGRTILHMSITNLNVVTYLLQTNVDQLAVNNNGQTALHLAVLNECPSFEVVKKLSSDYGCCIARDNKGNTALHLLCRNDYKKLLVPIETGREEVKILDKDEDPLLTLLVTETGSDIGALNDNKETPIHVCLRKRLFHKANILLLHGADIDAYDEKNLTPRMINPTWARKAILSMDMSDTGSQCTTTTSRRSRSNSVSLLETSVTGKALKSSLKQSSSNRHNAKVKKEVGMPDWVNDESDAKRIKRPWEPVPFGNGKSSEHTLTRELTDLHSEVDDVKNFLEEFSREGHEVKTVRIQSNNSVGSRVGGQTNKKSGSSQGLTRELTKLQDEVHDMKKMLQEVA